MARNVAPLLYAAAVIALACTAGCAHEAPPPPPPVAQPAAIPPPPPPPAPPVPPPPPQSKHARQRHTNFDFVNNTLKLPGPVVFEGKSDRLSPESDAVLEIVEDYLVAKPEVTALRIEGHTDSEGKVEDNQLLSEKRAMAVARWLVGHGIECKRLIPVGFGHTHPIVPNDTAENRAQNRRVAFVRAALNGKSIGGAPLDGGGKVAGDPCH